MEKRMILAIAMSLAVLIGYQYFFSAPPPPPGVTAGKDNAVAVPPQVTKGGTVPGPVSVAGGLAAKTTAAVRTITVKTPLYSAALATEGGAISSFLLNDYKDAPGGKGKPLDIVGGKNLPPLSLYLDEDRPPLPSPLVFASDAPAEIVLKAGETRSVPLTWESTAGVRMTRVYVFHGDKYEFEASVETKNGSKEPIAVRPGLELGQLYEGELAGDSYSFHGIVVEPGKGGLKRYDLKDISKGKVEKGPARWFAADAKYFAWIILPEREWTVTRAALVGETGIRVAAADTAATLKPGDTVRAGARVFAGPKRTSLLEATGKDLPELIDYGWFAVVAKPLVFLMKASNRVTGNYGIDIILLTILIKILFYPLTQKSMTSMRKMQELGPILKTLKEKYKGDAQRLNQETMNLYKTYKINPLSGCLPMLAQIPVFIALYKGLLVTIELRHAPFFLWVNDLSAPEHLWNFAVAGYTVPIRLLPLLMGVSMFIQQKMTPSAGMEPAQQKMMLFMPIIFTFMFWSFPTGLVIYWLVNNVLAIGQQVMYNRKMEAAKAVAS
ncbi:membrane protein insertase YidC [Candidatus Deferrimicrobium sp.]|uniref:membrane protein insertase YidC n=1 Tax=Candidatus Deferrimicrobium sp. TaxID=3060586 RepID=UPI002ED4C251